MVTQLNIKDGLKAYINKGDEAILKEVQQLHTRKTPMSQADITCHVTRGKCT